MTSSRSGAASARRWQSRDQIPVLGPVVGGLRSRLPTPYTVADMGLQSARGAAARKRMSSHGFRSIARVLNPSSGTLFVLGSGVSINSMTEQQFQHIRVHSSLGLNFWLVHPFVPSAYLQEPIAFPHGSSIEKARLNCRTSILSARAQELSAVPFIFRLPASGYIGGRRVATDDITRQLPVDARRVAVSRDLVMTPIPAQSVERVLRVLSWIRLLRAGRLGKSVPAARGSVFWAICFGYLLGYRRIVLCGVDLQGSSYFYDDPASVVHPQVPIPPSDQSGAVHRTEDPEVKGATMSEIVAATNAVLLTPQGVELFVADRSSKLFPMLDRYEWPEEVA